jgi:hypothetical protein
MYDIISYVNSRRCTDMTMEGKIRLLVNKASAYKVGYRRAVLSGDMATAGKWKEGYHVIKEKINELKEELAG